MSASESAKAFAQEWQNREGKEKQETQLFWINLLQKVYGISYPGDVIQFEKEVRIDGHNKYIDAYIPETKVLIEQKSADVNLDDTGRSSFQLDETNRLTPFQQAKRYSDWMPLSEKPRWIVICNFREIRIHDMEHPTMPHETVLLKNLAKEYYRLNFLFDAKQTHETRQKEMGEEAGRIVGVIIVEKALCRCERRPINPQRVSFLNMAVARYREIVCGLQQNLLGLLLHLQLCNPQGGLGNRHCEVVYLYAVEGGETDIDGRIWFFC